MQEPPPTHLNDRLASPSTPIRPTHDAENQHQNNFRTAVTQPFRPLHGRYPGRYLHPTTSPWSQGVPVHPGSPPFIPVRLQPGRPASSRLREITKLHRMVAFPSVRYARHTPTLPRGCYPTAIGETSRPAAAAPASDFGGLLSAPLSDSAVNAGREANVTGVRTAACSRARPSCLTMTGAGAQYFWK